MAWLPLSGIVPQATEAGNQANGYVLKFYEPGTTTPLAVSTNSTGTPTTTEFVLDAEGYTTLSGSRVVPHVDQTYKEVLYLNQADADADATGSAVYVVDNLTIGDAAIAAQVATNTADIATNTADIATNTSDIATNTANITTNTADIATNTSDIAANTAAIAAIGASIDQQLLNWSQVASGVTHTVSSSGMAFGNDANGQDAFVSAGSNTDELIISRNGLAWTAETNPTGVNLTCCEYGSDLFMAITSTGARVITSPDAEVWTEKTVLGITTGIISDLAYNASRWVCVTSANTTTNIVTSDDDGVTWTTRTNPSVATSKSLAHVIYANSQYLALAATVGEDFVLLSTDGTTWLEYTVDAAITQGMASVAYGNSKYVIPIATTAGSDLEIYTSANGQTWAKTTVTNNNLLKATPDEIIYANGYFVIISTTGECIISTDGLTWTGYGKPDGSGSASTAITYGRGRFIMGTDNIYAGYATGA